MKKWLALIVILASSGAANATAFTLNCASPCNWNAGASWTGGTGSNFPGNGDTATITAQQQVTIPSSITVAGVTITYNAGITSAYTKVIINGSLTLGGTMTLADFSEIDMGAGSIFDLNGNNVSAPGNTKYTFAGTIGSRATVQSTGSAGQFQQSGVNVVLGNVNYVDFSGLGPSVFGRNATSSFTNFTVTNCSTFWLEISGSTANVGITVSNGKFADPNTTGATIYEPGIDYGSLALGSNPRTIQNVTWSRSSPTAGNVGAMFIRAPGITINNVVVADWQWNVLNTDAVLSNSYQSIHTGTIFAIASEIPQTMTGDYFYFSGAIGGAHPFTPIANAPMTVTGSVFENTTLPGLKWFLSSCNVTASWTLNTSIFLGMGSALDFFCDTNPPNMTPTVLFYKDTYYGDQQNSFEGTPSATLMRVDHPDGLLTGSQVEFYNILTAKPNVSTAQNVLVSLTQSGANQVTYADYNTDFGFPGTVYSPPTLYSTGCQANSCPPAPTLSYSITVSGGYATHDFSADPQFQDRTRNVATWDTSLGGPGTEADALSRLLAGTTSPAALVSWVRAGFVPHNVAFHNTGRNADDIGAMPWAAAVVTGGIVQ